MSGGRRPWWEGPTPQESEKLDRAVVDMRAAVAPLLEALAGDLRRLAGWVGGRGEDQEQP